MSSLRERLKAKKLNEKTVTVDGDEYLVRELARTANNELLMRSSINGEVQGDRYEAEYMAACVCDPETNELVEPDWTQWADVPVHISDPLFAACMEVRGAEVKKTTIAKNSNATES